MPTEELDDGWHQQHADHDGIEEHGAGHRQPEYREDAVAAAGERPEQGRREVWYGKPG